MESWLSRTDLMPWFKNMDGAALIDPHLNLISTQESCLQRRAFGEEDFLVWIDRFFDFIPLSTP